jgi:hypothetical protein
LRGSRARGGARACLDIRKELIPTTLSRLRRRNVRHMLQSIERAICFAPKNNNNRANMDFETCCYEALPYIYGFAGWAALRNTDSLISIIAGVLLIALAALVLRERWRYRTLGSKILKRTAWRRQRMRRKVARRDRAGRVTLPA